MRNIDLNTASKEDLMEVPGIGSSLADKIIQFRDDRGGIDHVDELREVVVSESSLQELRAAAGESEDMEGEDTENEDVEEGEEEGEEW